MSLWSLMIKYANKNSILRINYAGDDITTADLKIITKQDLDLISRAINNYESYKNSGWFINNFSPSEMNSLNFLDKYFDIPILSLFYSRLDYALFHKLMEQKCEYIPIDITDINRDIDGFGKNCTLSEFKWLLNTGGIGLTRLIWQSFVKNGNLKCMEFYSEAESKGYRHIDDPSDDILEPIDSTEIAAKYGQLECLKYLHKNGYLWCGRTTTEAASNGHLDCLKYAYENGCIWGIIHSAIAAAKNGHVECLRYLHEKNAPLTSVDYPTDVAEEAVVNGHVDCVKFLHEIGILTDPSFLECAADKGHLDCVKYINENLNPSYDDISSAIKDAEENQHHDCAEYLHGYLSKLTPPAYPHYPFTSPTYPFTSPAYPHYPFTSPAYLK